MFLSYLTLFVALSLSVIAAYYSIAGLAAIFAAAVLPIVVMGSVLEAAKIVATLWLHEYWNQCRALMKLYLVPAVIMLMLITSMGIFGFLSKAHIEQTSAGEESVAQVERLTTEITRQQDVIKRAEEKVRQLQTSGTGADAQVQAQIDKEQERIDSAYKRVQPAIDEQNRIIGSQAKLYQDELDRIDQTLKTLQGYIDAGETKKAQQMIGASADGVFGKKTAEKIGDWKAVKQQERQELLSKIEQATNNPQARAASAEIKRLRQSVEREIAESNKLINRLRANIGKTDKTADIDAQVDEQNARIKTANAEIDTLTEQKYALESDYRKLEAEVGPIKYIAEFIYGEQADKNMLEKAVTWVIILIIFVFDPLAIMMLLAATESIKWVREKKQSLLNSLAPASAVYVDEPPDFDDLGNCHECGTKLANAPGIGPYCPNMDCDVADGPFLNKGQEPTTPGWMFTPHHPDTHPYLKQGFGKVPEGFERVKPLVAEELRPNYEPDDGPLTDEQLAQIKASVDEDDDIEDESPAVKEAIRSWKRLDPSHIVKHQRELFRAGYIDHLPWEDLIKARPDIEQHIGNQFPANPSKGDYFTKLSSVPTRLYKFNGSKWIEVDKLSTSQYTYNEAYIDWLIEKLQTNQYDPELLTADEQEQIAERIKQNKGN